MPHGTNKTYPDLEMVEGADEMATTLMESSNQRSETADRSIPTPPYSALMMPGSRAALMAVVDDNGYLIPVCTAFDLLRGCKYFWRASQD